MKNISRAFTINLSTERRRFLDWKSHFDVSNGNGRSLAFIVLITGIVGGLLIVFSILLLCKYCLNRKNLRETEQMKLLYETLNQTPLFDSNCLYHSGIREFSPLEPRRSNPLDRYQSPQYQWQIPSSKEVLSGIQGVHNQSYHESRELTGNKQHDSRIYGNTSNDDEPAEQYLQVDPRCYVRQNSNVLITSHRKSETPRLEKGHSLNVDVRPSQGSSTLSPYRQSSFDVTLAYRPHSQQQQLSLPSPTVSTQQEIYFTPRGSSLSVVANPSSNTPAGSQHLPPPSPTSSRKNSPIEKKDVTVQLDPSNQTSTVRSSIVPREHEYSRSLENSSPSNNPTVDKQSRSFDAGNLLRPVGNRADMVVNRRTKSYEYSEEYQPVSPPIAPPPIVIKIPDMSELVQAAQLSQLQNTKINGYQHAIHRKTMLGHQIIVNNHNNGTTASQDLWRLRQSYEIEEQQLDRTSPEDLSPDLLTSTSIDSAGAIAIHHLSNETNAIAGDDDLSKYQYRRKSSSNLLLPPPEVRRQALRRTFEKRRSCINQSNARREQQLLNNQTGFDDAYNNNNNNNNSTQSSTIKSTDFSSLLNNFNSKSENSSFDRSLETDFDMQSDTSSRGPNDQFTSIESSGNENAVPDVNNRFINNRQQQQQQLSPHQDDSGYKSLESQNSQNHTFSLDWMSADGGESVIYMGDSRIQQRSVDVKDLEEDLAEQEHEQQLLNKYRRSPKILHSSFHHSSQEASTTFNLTVSPKSNMMQQRSLSTNIPLDDRYRINPANLLLSPNTNQLTDSLDTSSSINRTASKKRREFGKDKRHAASNVGFSQIRTTDEQQFKSPSVHQVNEVNTKQTPSSLQVRYPDLRRSKSDESEVLDFSTKEMPSHSNKTSNNSRLLSSSDGLLPSAPSSLLSNPTRQGLPPNLANNEYARHLFQRSPSSTTPPVTLSPQVEAFRSKRGSVSFDNQAPPIHSPTSNKSKLSTTYSVLPTSVTKSRLKFSMVRDTTTASLGSDVPTYSMPINRDYSIDMKTNRIVNEFLMQDNNTNITEDFSYRGSPKRQRHRIRPKTFDETMMINNNNIQKQQQQSRTVLMKQRQMSCVQANIRKPTQHHYPSLQLADSIEQEEDSSNSSSPLSALIQQPVAAVRQDNSIPVGSPSIIITGYDSGS